MKKLLISIFALSYILNISAGETIELQRLENKPLVKPSKEMLLKQAPATRGVEPLSEDGHMFGYSFDIYDGIGLNQNYIGAILEGAIQIPKELAQKWKGNTVTAVNIGFGKSTGKEVNIYITKDLDGVPEQMQRAKITKDMDWNVIDLDTPYEIDGDAFYIGYQSIFNNGSDFPIAIDGIYSELPYGSIIGITYNGQVQYGNYGGVYGSVCLKAEISGDNFAEFDGMMNAFYQPDFVEVNEPFSVFFSMVNTGLSTITGADVTCKVNGKEIPDAQVTIYGNIASEEDAFRFIPFGNPGYVYIEGLVSDAVGGTVPIEITVDKLVGENGSGNFGQGLKSQILVASMMYDKNVVVEEYTGTWCGWCPRGIVGMEYMEHNYRDKGFIGIAVHVRDNMAVESYSELADYYYTSVGLPICTMNRTYRFDPNKESLEEYFLEAIEEKAISKVEVRAEYNEVTKVLTAYSTSEFAFDQNDAPYAIAYVITENKMGPDLQTNYFSGGKPGTNTYLEGWSDKGSTVPTLYNDVARLITAQAYPTSIKAQQPIELSMPLPLDDVKDVQKCSVVAMIVNLETGTVENSAKYVINEEAGVEAIGAEPADGIYKVFNLQGVKMLETKDATEINNLPKGFYIVNGKKVVVK